MTAKRALLTLVLSLGLASCGGNGLTEILVVVDSDIAIPGGMDAVRVEVTGATTMSATGSLTGPDAMALPRTVGVVRSGGSLGPIEIRVIGTLAGSVVAERVASTSFIEGKTLLLPMFLSSACVGVPACPSGQTCNLGSCISATIDPGLLEEYQGTVARLDGGSVICEPGMERCNGADDDCDERVDEDFDLMTDALNCGACFNACTRANAMTACAAGTCTVTGCEMGFGDCDADPTNGCEDDLTSAANCGACGTTCTYPNATGTCDAGTCAMGACDTGFDDCNSDPSDGCETPLNTLTDCGSCGTACAITGSTATCATGTCAIDSCTGLLGDCNSDPSDGCETPLDTLTDCGSCGTACSVAGGTATCGTGTCAVATCDTLLGDCNMDPSDGCETALTSLTNCGMCGTACTITNGTGTCTTGTCEVATCVSERGDCNMDPTDGCETNLRGNDTHCGMCGNACTPPDTCGFMAGTILCR